jgi:hypothetical protein
MPEYVGEFVLCFYKGNEMKQKEIMLWPERSPQNVTTQGAPGIDN